MASRLRPQALKQRTAPTSWLQAKTAGGAGGSLGHVAQGRALSAADGQAPVAPQTLDVGLVAP